LDQITSALRALEIDYPGVQIEEKPAGVAVHYRLAPRAAIACQEAAERAAMAIGMALQHGKMVIELLPVGTDKGAALRCFMSEQPFAGTHPIFIGDDLTDEHGFVAAREFGGVGILVGLERATAACYRLENVEAVRAWLGAACEDMP
jgi:trehalose 6-phosphate phosphatase